MQAKLSSTRVVLAKLLNAIKEQFFLDQRSWILWFVVLFCFGIVTYFSLSFEPSAILLISISCIVVAVLIYLRNKKYAWLLLALTFFIFGIDCAKIRTVSVVAPKLKAEIPIAKMSGRVVSISPTLKGAQIILDRLYIANFNKTVLPKKAKITINGDKDKLSFGIGDVIKFKANLKPPSRPLVPEGYNFARQNFFDQIGASGFCISNVYIIKKNNNKLANYIANLRLEFSRRIKNAIGSEAGSIAAALILGEQSAIDKQVLNSMRVSGLTHILSVSGLHLSMVSIICFFLVRFVLSCSLYIGQNYDTKKIAGYVSLLFTLGYLLISGMQIAAVRSYIMVVCVIVAVLLDRQEYALRSVCFAAFIMLIFAPESALHPSFQMSFSAVIALVSGYELYLSKIIRSEEYNIFSKIKSYLFGALAATFVAGLATAPFAIYYFNQYSNYSLLANMIVSPVTSFIIMPMVVLTCILYPFHMEQFPLWVMKFGIDFMVKMANWIGQFPKALVMLPNMTQSTLMLFVVGLLWLCLWQQKWRMLGVLPIVGAMIMLTNITRPDLIVDSHSGSVFVRSVDGNLVRTKSKKKISPFMADYFNSKMQTRNVYSIEEKRYLSEFKCLDSWCNIDDKLYFALNNDNQAAILRDNSKALLGKDELTDKGSFFVFIGHQDIRLQSVSDTLNERPWN